MSRDGRGDGRVEVVHGPSVRTATADRPTRARFAPGNALRLPQTLARECIEHPARRYDLNGEESRILATVGAFRVVPAAECEERSTSAAWNGAIRQLADQGLVERKTVVINQQPTLVLVLTREGKSLLDGRHEPTTRGSRQQYHAGLVKPREIGHDSQLYRLFRTAAEPLEAEGNRIQRVVLDYEFKRDYQTFLNRKGRPEGTDQRADMETFAAAAQLPVVDGHLELPDVRIEYETPDGSLEHRDLELVTEHYSRGQLAGKGRAGFALYRAEGGGVLRGGGARASGTPLDPHNLEWLR